MTECTAELDQVRSPEPAHFLIEVVVLAIPYSASRVLRVDVHGHKSIGVALGIDLHRRVQPGDLREWRSAGPLPEVPQEVEVSISGNVAADTSG